MKLKLFLVSILALLTLVAYQKYSEYSGLKSIDSYDSCLTAKGSRIQESYPATCVTRLGTRFTQSIGQNIKQTSIYSDDKYTLELPESWRRNNFSGEGMSAYSLNDQKTSLELIRYSPFDYTSNVECFKKTNSTWIKRDSITLIQYDYTGIKQIDGQCQDNSESRLKIILLAQDHSKNEVASDYLLFHFPESNRLSAEKDFSQILSTFKFTN